MLNVRQQADRVRFAFWPPGRVVVERQRGGITLLQPYRHTK